MVEIEKLNDIMTYDESRGILSWKHRDLRYFESERIFKSWNSRFAGSDAFLTKRTDGYLMGWIFGKGYLTHRVIWTINHGSWPDAEVDHINMDKSDNRIENLRLASREDNQHNRTKYKTNTSGFKGVSYHKQSGRWQSCINLNGKKKYLGLYDNPEDAHAVYSRFAKELHGEFMRAE